MEKVVTEKAPVAIGPYSQAVKSNGFVFVSGQLPVDPVTAQIIGSTPAEQAQQVITNIDAVLKAAGSSLSDVIKSTLYITDMDAFADINKVYASFFTGEVLPARVCVEVSRLPKNVSVEMDVIASLSN